jgi:peptidase A4-like protein
MRGSLVLNFGLRSSGSLRHVKRRLAALTVAISAAIVASTATAAGVDISSNWSGYAITGVGSTSTTASSSMNFTDVTATWTQPAAICSPGQRTSAAMWVGLGGYTVGSNSLEQTGTSADCDDTGKATYYAWYELVPAGSVTVKLKIFPGDTITSSVYIKGTDVLVQVKDRTRRTVFTKHLPMVAPDLTSAEWIAEAPSECSADGFCRTMRLTNFGSVTFSRIAALGNLQGGTLNGPGWVATPIQLVPRAHRVFGEVDASTSSTAGASPVNVAPDGSSFGVNWVAVAAP